MVDRQLRVRNITDDRVLNVMGELPREKFVPAEKQHLTYDDRALAIGFEQTISQPYMVALMTETLRVEPCHRVLEIGTGSGYQTAVLARLAGEVFSVERIPELSGRAQAVLAELGIDNVRYKIDDGSIGWREYSPYDRIIVTAGAMTVPGTLTEQLSQGGIMVIPVGPSDSQTLMRIEKRDGRVRQEPIISCRFVKLIGHEGWPGE